MKRPWHSLAPDAVCDALRTGNAGLSTSEARRRLLADGPNQLAERPKPGPVRRFIGQFGDVTVVALLVAAVIAVVLALYDDAPQSTLARYGDAIAIGIIVLMNAVIGFVQERKAESALEALQSMTAPVARVSRDGQRATVGAVELVTGDVVFLGEGDRVPADLRLLEASDVAVSEAALTGESAPVRKDSTAELPDETALAERETLCFMGTHVTAGRATGVVVATGMQTELGLIAGMLGAVDAPETPLQAELRRFGAWVVVGCVAIGMIVFAVQALRTDAGFSLLFLTAVSLAVAAIPEGLPAVTTIVLALGVQRMAARNALVRRLPAVEALGSAQVICSDKTGTLTQNQMTVRRLATAHLRADVGDDTALLRLYRGGKELSPERHGVLRRLVAACRFAPAASVSVDAKGGRHIAGNPTDGALLDLYARADFGADERLITGERPFDRERRLATVRVAEREGGVVGYTHGAFESVVAACVSVLDEAGEPVPLEAALREELALRMEAWAADGLRVLAIAERRAAHSTPLDVLETEMTLIGLVGMSDPPRPEVPAAILTAKKAGVATMMITGDHPKTARAIGNEVGLVEGELLSGAQIDEMNDQELASRLPRVAIVARATALHKLRIVQAFDAMGMSVAMTGDGVNDAPALKAATIGIAMGKGGTDVTREAADLVLSDDNYASIVAAIEEGRVIFSNIQKFILFLLSVNTGLVLAVFFASLLGWPPILTPTEILWINLITNGLPALALGREPVHLDPMARGPRDPGAGFVSFVDGVWLVGHGIWMALLGLLVFAYHAQSGDITTARTMAFTVLAIAPLFHAFNCRSRTDSIFALGAFGNRSLLAAFGVALLLQGIAVYVPVVDEVFRTQPLSPGEVAIALAVSASALVVGELEKVVTRRLAGAWTAPGDRSGADARGSA